MPGNESVAEVQSNRLVERPTGLVETSLGLQLRYELRREFAPYLGVEWERSWGRTGDLARAAGEPDHDLLWLAGVRFWF